MNNENSSKNIYIIVISFLAAVILVCVYLFAGHQVHIDNMSDSINVVHKDGKIYFEFKATDSGSIEFLGEISKTVLSDYENGIQYHYYFMSVKSQRFHLMFNEGMLSDPYFVLDETGREIHAGGNWEFDPDVDYEKYPSKMSTRYLRVFYENKDGSIIMIWEHPQAKEIERRVGTHVKEPKDYKIGD